MTAPLAPPPSRLGLSVIMALTCVAAAIPFGRREDWLGWLAFLVVAAAAAWVWGVLLWGLWRSARACIRNRLEQ